VNADSGSRFWRFGTARWVAAGFVLAFAASVFTVIYTGLMVEGSRAEFDAGFRTLEMRLDEVREARFVIDSEVAVADATLELEIPAFLEPVDPDGGDVRRRRIAVVPGRNEFSVELRAIAAGSGYVIARAVGEDALGRDSVFVTATSGSDVQ
jgi:hypothetical protein